MKPPVKNKSKLACMGKKRYPDEMTARATGEICLQMKELAGLYVYKCPHCRGYHLTRKGWNNLSVSDFEGKLH